MKSEGGPSQVNVDVNVQDHVHNILQEDWKYQLNDSTDSRQPVAHNTPKGSSIPFHCRHPVENPR